MSTIVRTIYDAMRTEIVSTLGSTWTELRFLFDVEQNDRNTANQGFGLIPGAASNSPTVIKTYTLDQEFEVILTRTNVREIDDADKVNALLDDLYNQTSELAKALLDTNIGLPGIVFMVNNHNISAPEFTANYVILRSQYTVKWRESIN